MKSHVPIYVEIFNDFHVKILKGAFKDGERLPSEKELCARFFVSRITMQKALNLLVEKGFLVRRAGKGSFIKTAPEGHEIKSKSLIGVMLCNLSVSYGLELLKSIEQFAAKSGYNIVFRNTMFKKELEQEILQELSCRDDIQGIILQPVHDEFHNPIILDMYLRNYPLVLIDRNLEGVSLPFVGTDNFSVTERVMNYLFEAGHKSIAFIASDPQNTTTLSERFDAIYESFSKRNIANNYTNHFLEIKSTIDGASPENIERDIRAVQEHLRRHREITCIFTAEYAICCIVKTALKRMNISVPDDISLVTFDNVIDPYNMTSTAYIKQNESGMAKKAVELLSKSIAGIKQNTKIYISAEFIANGSIANLKSDS
jgi:DNA-binding LacI/PurR family transcriptional regulator